MSAGVENVTEVSNLRVEQRRKPKATASMRAALLSEPRNFRLTETEIPEPGPDQLLIKLEGCGVCASNLPPWEGRAWFSYPMPPGALGHEGWGRVEVVGANVSGFSPGERVAFISNNAYAEFDIADAAATITLPNGMDAFPAEPLGCAMNILERSEIAPGNVVAVVGVGFLGSLLVQLACNAGARVLAISRRRFALELARRFGADEVLLQSGQVIEKVEHLTSNRLCDVVIEAAGKQSTLDLAAQLTRERGRLVIAGYHQDGLRQVNMQLWNWRGLDVINAHERDPLVYLAGIRAAIRALEDDSLDPRPLYTHRFPLSQIGAAFETAAARPDGFMKALVTM